MRAAAVVMALALSWAVPAFAQVAPAVDPDAPTITTRAERSKVQLGEPFHLTITVVHKPDMSVEVPAKLDLGEGFAELNDRTSTRTTEKDGLVKRTFVLTLGALETGSQTIPGLPLGYEVKGEHRALTTLPVTIEVSSLIGTGKEELRPSAQPVAVLERDYTLLYVLAGVALVLLIVGGVWLALRKAQARRPGGRQRSGKTTPPLPPDEQALGRLRALASSGQLDADDRRPVYFELSEIIREYLGARYGFDALELTTEELLGALANRAPADVVAELGAWLSAGDLVKYARVPSSRDEAAAALAQAVTLVERTRPIAAPVEPPAPPAASPAAPGGA